MNYFAYPLAPLSSIMVQYAYPELSFYCANQRYWGFVGPQTGTNPIFSLDALQMTVTRALILDAINNSSNYLFYLISHLSRATFHLNWIP